MIFNPIFQKQLDSDEYKERPEHMKADATPSDWGRYIKKIVYIGLLRFGQGWNRMMSKCTKEEYNQVVIKNGGWYAMRLISSTTVPGRYYSEWGDTDGNPICSYEKEGEKETYRIEKGQ